MRQSWGRLGILEITHEKMFKYEPILAYKPCFLILILSYCSSSTCQSTLLTNDIYRGNGRHSTESEVRNFPPAISNPSNNI